MPTLPTPQRALITAIEFDLMDGDTPYRLRLSDDTVLGATFPETLGGPIYLPSGDPYLHFRPCLYVPVEMRSGIISTGLDDVMPSSGDGGGTIKFSLRDSRAGHPDTPPPTWQFLDMSWIGRDVRIYAGELNEVFDNYELSHVCRVEDVAHDTFDVTVSTLDGKASLDDALVPFLYDLFATISGDEGIPDTLMGKPLPELRGTRYNIPAILVGDTNAGAPLYYQVSRFEIAQIMEVRVGGIPWREVALNPEAGEWAPVLAVGAFVLGGITEGLDVRCDARSLDWDQMTTAKLMTDLTTEGEGLVDPDSMDQLVTDAPHLIGWWTGAEAINRLDAYDKIMAGVGGWWSHDRFGRIIAGVHNRAAPIEFTDEFETPVILTHEEESDFPETDADFVLRDNIVSMKLSKTMPPAWRVRVEHTHNDGPLTSFSSAVREVDQLTWKEEGKVSAAWEDGVIKIIEPRAIDLPIVKSLVNTEGDARFIRDRIASVFGTPRKIYEVVAYIDAPDLYSLAYVDYMMVKGFYRVLSVTRGFGGGPVTMTIWG